MSKTTTKKSLINLIEKISKKSINDEVNALVEKRIQKLLPMLVEHEVNRLLKEELNDIQSSNNINEQLNTTTGNSIADEVIDDTETMDDKNELREHFKKLISGGRGANPNDVGRTINATSKNVHSIAGRSNGFNNNMNGNQQSLTTPDGVAVDTNNENVKKVLNAMNQDFSKKLKSMEHNSKQRNGQLTGGQIPMGGNQ